MAFSINFYKPIFQIDLNLKKIVYLVGCIYNLLPISSVITNYDRIKYKSILRL